jgi:hypothetical protein
MSTSSSSTNELFAKAILALAAGEALPPSITDALRELCPVPVVEPVVEPIVVSPVKEKKVRQTSKAIAAAAAAAVSASVTAESIIVTGAAPAPAPASAPAPAPAPVASTETGDPWRTHPTRLSTIDTNRCTGRRIDVEKPIVGTRKGDNGANNGMIFPEKQCSSKPAPGSKLCGRCADKDAAFKADPSKNDVQWHGRLDETHLYPRAKVVGSEHFLKKYPNGIYNDPFRPGATSASSAATTAPAVVLAETKGKREKKKATTAAPVAGTVAAVDSAPVSAVWKSFMHEGRLHIRNLENGKTYYADAQKNSPEEMAVKEHYVGRWVDGELELIGADSDEEA